MRKINNFTQGPIFGPMIKFTLPIMFALFLQVMYGAVDLWVVGKYATVADVSGVTVGSQLMATMTNLIAGLAMGLTVLLGQKIGQKKEHEAGEVVGTGIALFAIIAVVVTAILIVLAKDIVTVMNAPEEAFAQTQSYFTICAWGLLLIIAYNLIGGVFRGIGDSTTPLIAVAIACVFNIAGDLLLVKGYGMGAAGAAYATVAAQGFSVIISLLILAKRKLPFAFSLKCIRLNGEYVKSTLSIGIPVAVQSALVSISFLFVTAIVNKMGLTASAAVGVSEKLMGFLMLVPISMAQALAAIIAQNYGAKRMDRAKKFLTYGMIVAAIYGAAAFYFTFFHGDSLAWFFNKDRSVVSSTFEYLKAMSFDCFLTAFLFCFTGFFNGCGQTTFTLIRALVGAFGIRIPVAYLVSRSAYASLFYVGMATPASTIVEIIICVVFFAFFNKKLKRESLAT